MPPARGALSPYASLLGNRLFLLLWTVQVVSDLGTQFTRVALLVTVTALSPSAAAISVIFLLQMLPTVALGPFVGVLVDRWDRKTIMVLTDILRGAAILAYPFAGSVWALCLITAWVSLLGLFFRPARSAMIPEIVPRRDLMTAASINQFSSNGIVLLGPAAAGLLIAAAGIRAAFFVDAATFFVAAAAIIATRLPRLPLKSGRSLAETLVDAREGFRFIAHLPPLRFYLSTLSAIYIGGGLVQVLQYHYGMNQLGVGETGIGLFLSLAGFGGIVSALLLGYVGPRLERGRLMLGAAAALGLCFSAYLCGPGYPGFLLIGFLGNMFSVACSVPLQAMLYELVPADRRGRVYSIVGALFNLPTLIAYALAGVLAALAASHSVIGVVGLAMALGAGLAMLTPQYRQTLDWSSRADVVP